VTIPACIIVFTGIASTFFLLLVIFGAALRYSNPDLMEAEEAKPWDR
jgi:hypothetical protein